MGMDMIDTIFEKFRRSKSFLIDEFGLNPEVISFGIKKYEPIDNGVGQVTVFEKDGKIDEVGFLTPRLEGLVSYLVSEFSEPEIFYNFRDEFTRLDFYPNIDWMAKFSCDVDGHWESDGNGITNLDTGEYLDGVELDGFFIKLK